MNRELLLQRVAARLDLSPDKTAVGLEIGRYRVDERLGEGGMGVVYRAHDEELDRDVAIKVLRARNYGEEREEARTRLRREARAMARLNHPHVVKIHEVGVHDGRFFIAMELVDGVTLMEWLGAEERSWREILDIFLQAGDGLAAAHSAGLVHRDFKPDNVFVGRDGAVKVGDLGLVSVGERMRRPAAEGMTTLADETSEDLTRTGTIMGTPHYMSPEQFEAGAIDARSDQFSFSVALFEALTGRHPFGGEGFAELRERVVGGKLRALPGRTQAPSWVLKAVMRGLSRDVEGRWPTMAALLSALRDDPSTRRRRRLAVGVLSLSLVSAAAVLGGEAYMDSAATEACVAEGARIDEEWSAKSRERMSEAMRSTGLAHAEDTLHRTIDFFDTYAETWRTGVVSTCIEDRVDGSWDEALAERAFLCLEDRRIELGAMVETLSAGDADITSAAVSVASRLTAIEPCLDRSRLAALPPRSAREGDRVARRKLYRGVALGYAGKADESRALLLPFQEELAAGELSSMGIEAQLSLADTSWTTGNVEEAEAGFEEAYFGAVTIGAHEAAVSSALKLAALLGRTLKRGPEGVRWTRLADVSAKATGDASGLQSAAVLFERGLFAAKNRELDEAEALLDQVLEIYEVALGPDHSELAAPLDGLGQIYLERARDAAGAEAERSFERSLAFRQRAMALVGATYGQHHANYAHFLRTIGATYADLGRDEEARSYHKRALELLGETPQAQASAYNDYAYFVAGLGQHEEALALYEQAWALRRELFGADHVATTGVMNNIATVYLSQGKIEEALGLYRRVISIRKASLEPDDLELLYGYNNLGTALLWGGHDEAALSALNAGREVAELREPEGIDVALFDRKIGIALVNLGRSAEAATYAKRSLELYEAALGAEDLRLLRSILLFSKLKVLLGNVDEGVELARRAYALDVGALSEFGLGMALFAAGERTEGVELVRSARARMVAKSSDKPGDKVDLAEIEAWIAEHDPR